MLRREYLQEVVRDIFKPKTAKSAKRWTQDIAQTVDNACALTEREMINLGMEDGEWESVFKPALLWQFYRHLAAEMNQLADGHATVLANTLKGELDGLGDSD